MIPSALQAYRWKAPITGDSMSPRIAARAGALTLALFAFLGADLRAQVGADQVARASSRIPSTDTRWLVDPAHSQVDFRVSHLVGRVRGTFDDWFGVIVTQDDDWTRGTVNVTAQTRSVNTGNPNRDADLRSDRFFAADDFAVGHRDRKFSQS